MVRAKDVTCAACGWLYQTRIPSFLGEELLAKIIRIVDDPYWWTVALSSLVQLMIFIRWIYRRIRNDEMMRAFVEDMAKIHLPHTYALLENICDAQGIDPPSRPQINWIDLAGPRH
jgi:hypothetical protein